METKPDPARNSSGTPRTLSQKCPAKNWTTDPVSPQERRKFSFINSLGKNIKDTSIPAESWQRFPRISAPSTPQQKEFLAPPSTSHPTPPSSCCGSSRWPCHSRPCVPSGINVLPSANCPKVTTAPSNLPLHEPMTERYTLDKMEKFGALENKSPRESW